MNMYYKRFMWLGSGNIKKTEYNSHKNQAFEDQFVDLQRNNKFM